MDNLKKESKKEGEQKHISLISFLNIELKIKIKAKESRKRRKNRRE